MKIGFIGNIQSEDVLSFLSYQTECLRERNDHYAIGMNLTWFSFWSLLARFAFIAFYAPWPSSSQITFVALVSLLASITRYPLPSVSLVTFLALYASVSLVTFLTLYASLTLFTLWA